MSVVSEALKLQKEGAKLAREARSGAEFFPYGIKLAQFGRPIAKFQKKEELVTLYDALEDACTRKDEDAVDRLLVLIDAQNREGLTRGFRAMSAVARARVRPFANQIRKALGKAPNPLEEKK